MEKRLDDMLRILARNELLKIDSSKQSEELIQEYGMDAVEHEIVKNGYRPVLLQKNYETVEKMRTLQGEKERNL